MALSFLKIFKKEKSQPEVESAALPLEKSPGERLGRTIVPNAIRAIETEPVVRVAPPVAAPVLPPAAVEPVTPLPAAPRRTISLGQNHSPRVSLGETPAPQPPVASSAAFVSPNERQVALALGELLPQIAPELLDASQVVAEQSISFPAAGLERGMANGRPTVSLRSIYEQAPKIFRNEIATSDEREVALPFERVLLQFANFQLRDDQVPEEAVPQVQTPFSQVAVEDSARFGTPPPAKKIAPSVVPPPAKVAPSIVLPSPFAPAPVPPTKPAPEIPPPAPIRLPRPILPNESTDAPSDASPTVAPAQPNEPPAFPTPEKITPNGTDVPASERVPASSGPPVPTLLPAPFAPLPAAPAPVIVRPTQPDESAVAAPAPNEPVTIAATETKPPIHLSLRKVLRSIPPFQFTGRVEEIPEHAQLVVPFALIEPQLSLGKIEMSPADFQASMPEEFRPLFLVDEGGLPVALPLQEVLPHLPNEFLRLRDDQEEAAIPQVVETPFSLKAAEDAARLHVPAAPITIEPAAVADEEAASVPLPIVEEAQQVVETPAPISQIPAAIAETSAEAVTEKSAPLDAKSAVEQALALPGIRACVVVFSDGLTLAGTIPAGYGADAICAMAPEIIKRINDQSVGACLGPMESATFFFSRAPMGFFSRGSVCLVVLQETAECAPETRAALARIAGELAQTYSRPNA